MTRDFQSTSEYEDADTSICYQTFSYIGKGVSYAVFPFFHVIFKNAIYPDSSKLPENRLFMSL